MLWGHDRWCTQEWKSDYPHPLNPFPKRPIFRWGPQFSDFYFFLGLSSRSIESRVLCYLLYSLSSLTPSSLIRCTFLFFLFGFESGIFKIDDSNLVATLWGKRKNRPAMNYDKLSRSIRQYYKKGIIKKTDKSQRLVYQFCQPYRPGWIPV